MKGKDESIKSQSCSNVTLRQVVENNGIFSVKLYYEKLLDMDEVAFPYSSVEIPGVPRKVFFFIWLATREVILPVENLRK